MMILRIRDIFRSLLRDELVRWIEFLARMVTIGDVSKENRVLKSKNVSFSCVALPMSDIDFCQIWLFLAIIFIVEAENGTP